MVQGEPHELSIDHEMLPVQIHEHIIPESPLVTAVVSDTITLDAIERSTTPPPPSSSPPPLSPTKADKNSSSDDEEQWREPQLKNSFDDDDDSCSSFDTDQLSGADDLLDEIDQSTNHSNLSAIAAKGMNDSLGTLSNLSEVSTSQNLLSPPPLPLSPPPDL